jgi:hypothetical protein
VLTRAERSDGKVIPLGVNLWTTDRTFIGLGKRPRRENLFHLLDHASTGSYTLYYDQLPSADDAAPASVVRALPASSPATFPVSWEGNDNDGGTGIVGYDVYVSTDGRPFVRWLTRTRLLGSLYEGALNRTYAFYSRAADQAGNEEPAPTTPDTVTTVGFASSAPSLRRSLRSPPSKTCPSSAPDHRAGSGHSPGSAQLHRRVVQSDAAPHGCRRARRGPDRTLEITPQPDRFGESDVTSRA